MANVFEETEIYSSAFGRGEKMYVCRNCTAKYSEPHDVCPFCGYDGTKKFGHYGVTYGESHLKNRPKRKEKNN